jgi:hypothetical protein
VTSWIRSAHYIVLPDGAQSNTGLTFIETTTSLGKSQEHGEELVMSSIWILNSLKPCSGLYILCSMVV